MWYKERKSSFAASSLKPSQSQSSQIHNSRLTGGGGCLPLETSSHFVHPIFCLSLARQYREETTHPPLIPTPSTRVLHNIPPDTLFGLFYYSPFLGCEDINKSVCDWLWLLSGILYTDKVNIRNNIFCWLGTFFFFLLFSFSCATYNVPVCHCALLYNLYLCFRFIWKTQHNILCFWILSSAFGDQFAVHNYRGNMFALRSIR